MARLYYTAPSDGLFQDIKECAIELWSTMGDEEKIGRIRDMGNISDNFMYILAMFDQINQRILFRKLKDETRHAVNERMVDGGNSPLEI